MTVVSYELTPDEMSRLSAADDVLGIVSRLSRGFREQRGEARTGDLQAEMAHMDNACCRVELEVKRYREEIYRKAMERGAGDALAPIGKMKGADHGK